MRRCKSVGMLMMVMFLMVGCGAKGEVIDALVAGLQTLGYEIVTDTRAQRDVFEGTLTILTAGAEKLYVYWYPTAPMAEEDATRISKDGLTYTKALKSQVQSTTISWVDTPYFFRKENIIILYVGSDKGIITTLEGLYGLPFAGGIMEDVPVTLGAREATATEVTLSFTYEGEDQTVECTTADWYCIESKVNGRWQALPTIMADVAWSNDTISLSATDPTELVVNWEDLYGVLKTDQYRISKEVFQERGTEFLRHMVYAVFEVVNRYE